MTDQRTWVFGYGSLVSPDSFGATIGRRLAVGPEFVAAELVGFGRRWNYGIGGFEGVGVGPDGVERSWTLIALGVIESPEESVNGVVVRVSATELADLDRRERNYDRVDVTASIDHAAVPGDERIVTYVPRAGAIALAESAHASHTAAIERRYHDLVIGAFSDLGPGQLERYLTTTPDEGMPVIEVVRHPVDRRSAGTRVRPPLA
ncbi:MAG: dephospho-CoA kinase [Actinomycetota bacterium]|jgi:cation transport regulator ChaC